MSSLFFLFTHPSSAAHLTRLTRSLFTLQKGIATVLSQADLFQFSSLQTRAGHILVDV